MSEAIKPKPEVNCYVVEMYGINDPNQVEDVLNRLRRYRLSEMVVLAYRPEMKGLSVMCNPGELIKLDYALPMMFMQGHISRYQVDAIYRSVQIRCYDRDEDGRRYRWFDNRNKAYIDPKPAEASQAA